MSRLIKSSSTASQVRALDLLRQAPTTLEPDPRDLELATRAERIAALEAELTAHRAAEAQRIKDAADAETRAEARGHAAGLEAADARADERISRLELGMTEARARLDADLENLERLAALLAETALARLIDDTEHRQPLIAATIRRQMQGLEASAVLHVEVSPRDFPTPEALEPLAREAGLAGVRIETVTSLAAGGCRLKLRLGELEVGLDQQWGALRAVLVDLAASPAGAEPAP